MAQNSSNYASRIASQTTNQSRFSNAQVPSAGRSSTDRLRYQPVSFEEEIKMVYNSIQSQMPNIPSLLNFFNKYDAYQGRVFNAWELGIMFPQLDPQVLENLYLKNQEKSPVKKGDVQLSFLIDEIELTQPNLIRQNLPKESAYLTANVSQTCEQSLTKLSQNREVQYNPSIAFDSLFKGIKNVDCHQLDRAFRDCGIMAQVSELSDVLAYFAMDRTSITFNKIQFTQGIQPWVDKKRPAAVQGFPAQGQQFYGTMQSQMMMQPNNGMGMPYNQQQQMMQPQMAPVYTNQQPNMQPQTMMQQQVAGMQQTPLGGYNPQFNTPFPQDLKYAPVIDRYSMDLELIHDALIQRHTGAFSWFRTQSVNGVSLTQQEFSGAIFKLNLPQVRTSTEIYLAQQAGSQMPVTIQDIDGLFKAFNRRNKPKIISEQVLESILRAFNTDDQFIMSELFKKSQPITIEHFCQFFGQYPEHTQYYQLPHVAALAETFCSNGDSIDLNTFNEALVRRRRETNMQRNPSFQGIQASRTTQQPQGYAQTNPLMPGHSSNYTKAATVGGQPPNGFIPHMDEGQINEIVKNCFCSGKLCYDHFRSFSNNEILTMNDFVTACSNLGCSFPMSTAQQIYSAIDRVMNGVAQGQVAANDIDRYIHFSMRKNLKQLHDNLLIIIESQMQLRNVNLMSEFARTGRPGLQECQYSEFKQIINQLGVNMADQDINFVSKSYQVGSSIQYLKFIEDINQISRQSTEIKMVQTGENMQYVIAESIIKKLHILKYQDLTQFLAQQQKSTLTVQDFKDLIGGRLELVPTVCQDHHLAETFFLLSNNAQGQLQSSELVRFIENKCPKSISHLMNESTKKLYGQNLQAQFENYPDYQRSRKMLLSEFKQVLVGQFRLNSLDAEFLAAYFSQGSGGDVDVQNFINECNQAIQGNKTQVIPIVKKIATAVSTRKLPLNELLSKYRVGNSGSIPSHAFATELNNIVPLTSQEQEQLGAAYQSKSEGRSMIDYIGFLEDIKLQSFNFDTNQVALTKDQQSMVQNFGALIKTNGLVDVLTLSMRQRDYMDAGYVSFEDMQQAVRDTMAKLPIRGQTQTLNTKQLQTLFSVTNQDQSGRFNWKKLLHEVFGYSVIEESLKNVANMPQSQQQLNQTPVMVQAENARMGAIGKKIGSQANIFLQELTKSAKQIVANVPYLGEFDVSNVLATIKVYLELDERLSLQEWCSKNKDAQAGLINSHRLLLAMGLQPPSVERKGAPKRILSEQELRAAQDLITLIRKEIMSQGIRPEQMISKYRRSPQDITMSPKAFRDVLIAEFGKNQLLAPKIESKTVLADLIHYLVREEAGRVSYGKLSQALALGDQDKPLAQEGVQDLVQYQANLRKQLTSSKTNPSIVELYTWMKRQDLSLATLLELQPNQLNQDLLLVQFEKSLANRGYVAQNQSELIQAIQTPETGKTKVSIALLQKQIKSLLTSTQANVDQRQVMGKFSKINPQVKSKLQQISDYMIRNNITLESMHKQLDVNGDGSIDKLEFVTGLSTIMTSSLLTKQDLGTIFDMIDINGDNYLSVNEFGYFLQGVKLKKEEKKAKLDQGTIMEVTREIDTLFAFLENGLGYVTANELHRSMMAIGQNIPIEKAKDMILSVDYDKDGKISRQEFSTLMLPILLDELVAADDQLEDMRAKFIEADTDYSGFLSVDEFYICLLNMGADVTRQEVVNMFTEFDVNQDMQIDIDEFIKFFSVGDQVEFTEEQNVSTYMKIKKARKLNILDFLRAHNQMPQSFMQSFFTERWLKSKKNLPSSVFIAQIDPNTMLWKDMAPVFTEDLPQTMVLKENRPRLRPVASSLGSTITIEGAEGVPLPLASDFDRNSIVKRVIRVGLYDKMRHELVHNTVQVMAEWNPANEDVWEFNQKAESLNPVYFRTTATDDLNRQETMLVFELVVYVRSQNKTTEWTAGWAETPIATCEKDVQKVRLEIQGGSPHNTLAISSADVQTKRSGMKAVMKMFNKNIKSTIIVSFKPIALVEPENKLHLELLPSTCLIQKKMLYFVSGYRNYAAELLLPQMAAGNMKKPIGNVVMSSFGKILDCPDLLEGVALIWHEDYVEKFTLQNKKSIELIMKSMEEVVNRIYPILFSDGFDYHTSNPTESACGDREKLALRKQLVQHALRFNRPAAKIKVTQPPDALTTFKPFNVKEIEYEVWGC